MRRLLRAAVLAATVVASAPATPSAVASMRPAFESSGLPVAETKLFDLGVADRDRDGRLDVYTVNHSYPESWLERPPAGPFADLTVPLGLAQDPRFPGWERTYGGPPPPDRGPGLYVYITKATLGPETREQLVLEARGVGAAGSVVLDPERHWQVTSLEQAQIDEAATDGADRIGFSIAAGGRARLQVGHLDLPIALSSASAAAPLFLGADAVPGGFTTTVSLRDRHAYALGDLDEDGREDLFSVVGGLGGDIAVPPFRGRVFDELLAGTSRGFRPMAQQLPKDDCRGRQADIVDIDADGDADLFASCEAGDPSVLTQTASGFRLSDIPDAAATTYRWVAADRDPRPELLVAGGGPARMLELGANGWRTVSSAHLLSGVGDVRSISVGDFDGDGRADFLCASPDGNTLLRGLGKGRIRAVDPQRLGLPARSAAASWVDVDLDGRLDLHTLPQGLFMRAAANRFRLAGELSIRPAPHAISLWADLDNDGRRDSIAAVGSGLMGPSHEVSMAINRTRRRGRWLELDLPGAAQTARITVHWNGRTSVGWAGQADDSPFSQTHDRVYFGLGRGPETLRARIRVRGAGIDPVRLRTRTDRIVRVSP